MDIANEQSQTFQVTNGHLQAGIILRFEYKTQ
jgi:hypothetical protein